MVLMMSRINSDAHSITYYSELKHNEYITQDAAVVFYMFADTVFHMRDRTTCSVCLDVYEVPVSTACHHRFCKKCIVKHFELCSEDQVYCPICWKPISEGELKPLTHLNDITAFIASSLARIESLYGSEGVSRDFNSVVQKVKEDSSFREFYDNLPEICPSEKLMEMLKSLGAVLEKAPSGPPLDPGLKKHKLDYVFHTLKTAPPENMFYKANRFDSVTKTYKKNPDPNKKEKEYVDKIQSFVDDSNKQEIVEWLDASQNEFGRKLLTQENDVTQSYVDFDMPSVSQKHSRNHNKKTVQASEIQRQQNEQTKIRERSNFVTRLSRRNPFTENFNSNRRTRSLDCVITDVKRRPKLKRHSLAVCEVPADEVVIEQVDSEEIVRETQKANKSGNTPRRNKTTTTSKPKKISEKQRAKGLSNSLCKPTTSKVPMTMVTRAFSRSLNALKKTDEKEKTSLNTSGWSRIKDINKTISKTERKPKKLNVVEIPCNSSSVEKQTVTRATKKKKLTKSSTRKKQQEIEKPINIPFPEQGPAPTYNLNDVESYFNKNIEKVMYEVPNTSQIEEGRNEKRNEKSDDTPKIKQYKSPLTKKASNVVLRTPDTNKKLISRRLSSFSNEKENKISSEDVPKKTNGSYLDEQNGNRSTKNVDSTKSTLKEHNTSEMVISGVAPLELSKSGEAFPRNLLQERNNILPVKNDNYDDDPFTKPTQMLTMEERKTRSEAYDENLYNQLTQIVIIKDDEELNNKTNNEDSGKLMIQQRLKVLHDILNNCSTNIKSDFVNKTNVLLEEILQLVNTRFEPINKTTLLNSSNERPNLYNEMCHNQKAVTPKQDVQIQTEVTEISSSHSLDGACSKEIGKHVAIQTDSIESPGGFRISSTDMFHSRSLICAEVQTDPHLICPGCNGGTEREKQAIKNSTEIEKYLFTEGLDDIDFETQEIVKQIQLENLEKNCKNVKNDSKLCIAENGEQNKAESIEQNKAESSGPRKVHENIMIPQESKQVENEKSYKRIRKVNSDSDPELDVLPKNIKRNKYMQENLSIHFLSESMENDVKPKGSVKKIFGGFTSSSSSEESQGINYVEYLDNILKKCDEDVGTKRLPSPKAIVEQPLAKRSKTQDMIKECEMIIKEACTHTINLENTEIYNREKQPTLQEPSNLSLTAIQDEFFKNFSGASSTKQFQDARTENAQQNLENFESLFLSDDGFPENICFVDDKQNIKQQKNDIVNLASGLKGHGVTATTTTNGFQPSKLSLDQIINEFNKDDSMVEDAEVNVINESVLEHRNFIDSNERNSNRSNEKVKILQVVRIVNDDVVDIRTPSNDIEAIDGKNSGRVIDPADTDDESLSGPDVVETTPQKGSPDIWSFSQYPYINAVPLPPPLGESQSPCDIRPSLTKTLTPPLQFQDFSEDKTLVEAIEGEQDDLLKDVPPSLTPDLLLPRTSQPNVPYLDNKRPFTSTQKSGAPEMSTPDFSPITVRVQRRTMNPIQMAQNSKYSPLTVIKNKTPPSQHVLPLFSSTPKQKSILNYIKPKDHLNASVSSQISQKSQPKESKPCVACTRLSKEQLLTITSLSNKKLIRYSSTFTNSVSHMIVAVNGQGHLKDHTMKFVLAVAAGIWVINFGWIEECLKQEQIVPEGPYEALDLTGFDGPRQSRFNRLSNPLLKGYKIHVAPPFVSATKKDVEEVITLLGGEVVARLDDLLMNNGKVPLIVTEAKDSQDFELYETWLEMLKVVTVDLEWLTRSVGQYKVLSLRPFTLCTEDSICDLGYPPELLLDMDISCFESCSTVGAT